MPFAVVVVALVALGCTPALRPAPDRATAVSLSVGFDHFGYRPGDSKLAVASADPGAVVEVRTRAGESVLRLSAGEGSIRRKGQDSASGDEVWWLDLSALNLPGTYHLWSPSLQARSYEFVVAHDVYEEVLRSAVRTFYLQRCGVGKLARHAGSWADEAACHRADASAGPARDQRDRGRLDLSGGWHDAGDYNKYMWYATSNAILFMLRAFEEDPGSFPDGFLRIPESGNGVSDLLDEVRWELDFLLKMQLQDGSVLSRIQGEGEANGSAPPSADRSLRYYHDPTVDSAAVFAGSCAVASRVFAAAGQGPYAATLKQAALRAWSWLRGQGNGPEKVWAAAEILRLDPGVTSARAYVDGYHPAGWSGVPLGVTSYDAHAALAYVQVSGATAAVVSAMRADIAQAVDRIFASDDLYRNGMPKESYFWGSNSIRAGYGVFLLQAARLHATGSHTGDECRRHALDFLHYFHGQNPLGMVYLTNMASLGGEHSSWQIFHNWFGQSQSRYSRSRYIGRAASAVEAQYPYFAGTDNHGVRDDKTSLFGPAPGFVPGGPNQAYSGDARPPGPVVYPNRCYRDWNDQTVWTARTWEITEPSIGYQGPYVALVAAFAGRALEGAQPDASR